MSPLQFTVVGVEGEGQSAFLGGGNRGRQFPGVNVACVLVHLERFDDISAALRREKQHKAWTREWKLALIREHNPKRADLYEEACRAHVSVSTGN